ncbi:hypothetical protein [Butyricimonas paravirosa]|uniref:hypothetical protein n=1 Tax=Butyricimonas paravirosa TaxID=1472417 RepID=UPI00210E5DB1|nr:hypothetical protein [Butyricimonas paravirosa]MCQ4873944.1 hypothetical protein [Butyricimonas paravirosa]
MIIKISDIQSIFIKIYHYQRIIFPIACILLCHSIISCSDDDTTTISEGIYTHKAIQSVKGFEEEKAAILTRNKISEETFISLSTDSAWSLESEQQALLATIRDEVSKPDEQTLLQKVIPLEDISTYMNNIYGGTVGGFVAEAADVKSLATMYDVYWGLRLDYKGTKFSATGAGYAVIRFYSDATSRLKIPYSPELGGTQEHAWPNGGGGFTTSTLGAGGYPEWVMDGYSTPREGAELYEVTPAGREILRSVYREGRWQTHESEYYPLPQTRCTVTIRNGIFNNQFITTYGEYAGHTFIVRGEVDGEYHLTTTETISLPGLHTVEKGIYGINVPKDQVSNVHEVVE